MRSITLQGSQQLQTPLILQQLAQEVEIGRDGGTPILHKPKQVRGISVRTGLSLISPLFSTQGKPLSTQALCQAHAFPPRQGSNLYNPRGWREERGGNAVSHWLWCSRSLGPRRIPVCIIRRHAHGFHDVRDGDGGRARDASQTVNNDLAAGQLGFIWEQVDGGGSGEG